MSLGALARTPAETVLSLGGEDLLADPLGALWWAAARTLIVSDLHLEKGSAFARRGRFLPPYDTAETLARLAALVRRYAPARIVALGDSFHDAQGPGRMAAADRETLAGLQRGRSFVWIAGNHDRSLVGGPPGESAERLCERGLSLAHEPAAHSAGQSAQAAICGHLHPCAKLILQGRGLRRRAFAAGGRLLVMPAFGAYAGGLNVRDPALSGLFADGFAVLLLGAERLYTFPGALCLPD